MKNINHPNIIKLHEVIDNEESEKLFMGWVILIIIINNYFY